MATLNLRPATKADEPELLEVFLSAFHDSVLNAHCFPPSDPASAEAHISLVKRVLPEVTVATDPAQNDKILGWVRWVRKPVPSPHIFLDASSYPSSGNPDLGRRFFQANVDATTRIVQDQAHWFLSLLVVRRDAQRKGVGMRLMRYGLDQADEEGWMAYCNGSADGKPLYEACGFRTIEETKFEFDGLQTWHMKREAKDTGKA